MTPRELAGALRRQLNPRRARWQRPAALVRALRLRRGETVAEIGCGPGYFTARLARAVGPAGHVFAVDPEPAVLDIMRRRLRGVRNVTPVLGREEIRCCRAAAAAPQCSSTSTTTCMAVRRSSAGWSPRCPATPA